MKKPKMEKQKMEKQKIAKQKMEKPIEGLLLPIDKKSNPYNIVKTKEELYSLLGCKDKNDYMEEALRNNIKILYNYHSDKDINKTISEYVDSDIRGPAILIRNDGKAIDKKLDKVFEGTDCLGFTAKW